MHAIWHTGPLQDLSVSNTMKTNETASAAPTKLVAPNAKESAHALLGNAPLHDTKLDYDLLGMDQHISLSTMKESFATKAQRMTHTHFARLACTEKKHTISMYRLYMDT